MKLSEYKDEDALVLLADLIEPLANIFADKKFYKIFQKGNRLEVIKYVLKNKPKQVLAIMARLDGVPPEKYEANIFTLPTKLMEILSDEELMRFFASQGLKMDNESFGSVMESTEETEKK